MKKCFKLFSAVLAFLLCVGIFLICNTTEVKAEDIASGTSGSCSWVIDENGAMTISPTNGTSGVLGDSYWYNDRASITSVYVAPGVKAPTSLYQCFYSLSNCVTIDAHNMDVSDCKNFSSSFSGMTNVQSVDVSGWDISNATDMAHMFSSDKKLSNINMSGWSSAPNLKDISWMFYEVGKSSDERFTLDLTGFDVSSVTNMYHLAAYCGASVIDCSGWDTSNATNMGAMFDRCRYLGHLLIPTFDTSSATNLSNFCTGSTWTNDVHKSTEWYVDLGPNFNFKGNNITDSSKWARFGASEYTTNASGLRRYNDIGKRYDTSLFMRADGSYGYYTMSELIENYTPEMAGTWTFAPNVCTVAQSDGKTYLIRPVLGETYENGEVKTIHDANGNAYTGKINYVKPYDMDGPGLSGTDAGTDLIVVDSITAGDLYLSFASENWVTMDLRNIDVSSVTNMNGTFCNMTNLKYLDISTWDMRNVTTLYGNGGGGYGSHTTVLKFFENTNNLQTVVLGPNFRFSNVAGTQSFTLPIPPTNSTYNGQWVRIDEDGTEFGPFTSLEIRDNWDESWAGTWTWAKKPTNYTINFVAPDAAGSMVSVKPSANQAYTLPPCDFVKFGANFDHWDDGRGRIYSNMETIPANRYTVGTVITMTAVFVPRDTSVEMQDGTFEFTLRDGEKATFKGIPAGTSYQVYELTPDGWVLVQQENTSGVIQPLQESAAKFWNQYIPGITTIQFSGTKLLDGKPAEANSFNFELVETTAGANGSVTIMNGDSTQDTMFPIQTSVIDGGFIQFPILVYDEEGTHTYEIREVNPNDDTIDYDLHVETVTVVVTDDGHGNLTCEATYDADGVHFINTSRPGGLKITKDVINGSDANADDEFTFEVEFANPNGMPFDEEIYWYVEGENNGD